MMLRLGLSMGLQQRRYLAAAIAIGPGTIASASSFESIGLYWSPAGGGPDNQAHATFRRVGEAEVHTSLDFTWSPDAGEYRGSLLMLESGSDYEVTLWCDGQSVQTTALSTWSETLPIAQTIQVPTGVQAAPYLIEGVHGSPGGYILYEPADDRWLDGKDVERSIDIRDSSYVIVRGFKIRNTRQNAIRIDRAAGPTGVHDVVIDDNEITNWGRIALFTTDLSGMVAVGDTIMGATSGATGVVTATPAEHTVYAVTGKTVFYADDNGLRFQDGETVTASSGGSFTTHQQTEANGYTVGFGGYGAQDYAITTEDMNGTTERLIIQRNHIHTPRGDTNSWQEASAIASNSPTLGADAPATIKAHPIGPGGIFLEDTLGHHVVRWNTIHGAAGPTPGHADKNGSYLMDGIGGRPDGTTGSVRRDSDVYGNDVRYVWDDAIELESYGINVRVWGNFIDQTFVAFGLAPITQGPTYLFGNAVNRFSKGYLPEEAGTFGKGDTSKDGTVFVLHNTVFTDPADDAPPRVFLNNSTPAYWIRNNIARGTGNVYGGSGNWGGDLDYDLWEGKRIKAGPIVVGSEVIEAAATYASSGSRFLAAGTPGQGDALVLPNLEWLDRGAEQTGEPPLEFGHDAR